MALPLDNSSPPANGAAHGGESAFARRNGTIDSSTTEDGCSRSLSLSENGNGSDGSGHFSAKSSSSDSRDSGSLRRYPGLSQETNRTSLRDSQFSEEQVVRLMLQELRDRGFADTFELLQRESGHTLEDEAIAQFRGNVLAGKWIDVEKAMSSIIAPGADSEKTQHAALFIVKRQQFLEFLEARKLKQALVILQNELSMLTDDIPQLHRLSSLLMCPSAAELHSAADWDGSSGRSRYLVLEALQKYILPGKMVPVHRMETLYSQAIMHQCGTCERHVRSADKNLYIDHKCPESIFPLELQISLKGHKDEVWYVAFSPDGRYLASASCDKTCILWSTEDYSIARTLVGHEGEVSYLAWSPNSKYIVSAGSEKVLRLWDVETGETLQTFEGHSETVASCRWLGDNDKFISGGMDQKIIIWSTKGNVIKQIASPRVHDLAVSVDSSLLLVADDKSSIHMYDLATLTFIDKLDEPSIIMSLALSPDARFCITELRSGVLHMWDLEARTRIREFSGHKQGKYVIRCAFAGLDGLLVVEGSETGQLFVWNRNTGRLLTRLDGHTKTINGCSWSDKLAALATASDDKTISVWPAYHGAPSCVPDSAKHKADTLASSSSVSRSMASSSAVANVSDDNDDDQSMLAAV
ncbi:hypothetical protein IW140_004048 [Coemansia sp. RSA 1813]|nr:hypothetical protein EV178_003072 [Coemansia sp. RSA 1646]KAJ2214947.1 hypothetical protein EV179_002622 [Coemansia sp. RSA 487]KAJ2568230.1 hypothetical protein IW140_004048 [Coemansia sp. RSA 1813]